MSGSTDRAEVGTSRIGRLSGSRLTVLSTTPRETAPLSSTGTATTVMRLVVEMPSWQALASAAWIAGQRHSELAGELRLDLRRQTRHRSACGT